MEAKPRIHCLSSNALHPFVSFANSKGVRHIFNGTCRLDQFPGFVWIVVLVSLQM